VAGKVEAAGPKGKEAKAVGAAATATAAEVNLAGFSAQELRQLARDVEQELNRRRVEDKKTALRGMKELAASHEPSGYAMKDMLGVGKGTCSLADFERAELIMVIGQNPASNHPRMMAALHAAAVRGARVIALNPLDELGFRNFCDPKDMSEMVTGTGRRVAEKVYRVMIGGDLAALKGVMKIILERRPDALDREFIAAHTTGFEALRDDLAAESWDTILAESGLPRSDLEEIADVYAESKATMCTWCMGITHHEHSVATIQTIVNLLLLKGNIGKPGAGAVPVRGHSNVQGNRTMGATGRVPPRFLDQMERVFGTGLQREPGLDAVGVAQGLIAGSIRGFLALGGNYAVAAPDSLRILKALEGCELTVHIATKPNRPPSPRPGGAAAPRPRAHRPGPP
jgi:molybdopterin-dependent oxidoreductase alpha subunit